MVLRKITIDNSVRSIPKSEQTKERDIKSKTIKLFHYLANKTKQFQKIIQSSLKMFQHKESNILNE